MAEKLTKTIEVAEVKDAVEPAVEETQPVVSIYDYARDKILPGSGAAWTEDRLREMADFVVDCGPIPYTEISRNLGRYNNYLTQLIIIHPLLGELIDERRKLFYRNNVHLAQNVALEALANPDVPWASKVAVMKDIMSRAQHDPVTKVENTNRELVVELNLDED